MVDSRERFGTNGEVGPHDVGLGEALLPPLPGDSFYERLDETTYASTRATESPWQSDLQHGGPPAALLTRAIAAEVADESLAIGKLEVDFLGPIPQGRCIVEVGVVRPGRQVRQVQALMTFPDVDERPAVAARAWLFSAEEGRSPRVGTGHELPALPATPAQGFFAGVDPHWGYGRSIEWRFVAGGFEEVGAATVWTRVRLPLVAGEPTADLERMVIVADSTNGISAALPMRDWLSIPPALTVAVLRPPADEWFLVAAASAVEPRGTGVAQSVISDARGTCAHVLQPLLIAPRRGTTP